MNEHQETTALIAADYPEHTDTDGTPQFHWWELDVEERTDGTITERVYARLLGFASSHEDKHSLHTGEHANPKRGEKCSACRWVEVSIYDISKDPDARKRHRNGIYLVQTVGRSDAPGEVDRTRLVPARNAPLVLEALYQSQGGTTYLTVPSRLAMGEASAYDESLARVWASRRVG